MRHECERRAHRRLEIQRPICLRITDDRACSGKLMDLSTGGAAVELSAACPVRAGDAIELSIEWSLPAAAWVRTEICEGRVSHRDDHGRVGIEFVEPRMPHAEHGGSGAGGRGAPGPG